MSLEFKRRNDELILFYRPENGESEHTIREIQNGGTRHIRNCFSVTKSQLRPNEDEFEDDLLLFCIGSIGANYTKLDIEVFGTDNDFYFANFISLSAKMFTAYRNISVLRKLDQILKTDVYIGKASDPNCNLPLEVFLELIGKFPTSWELNRYTDAKISMILKEHFGKTEEYELRFQKYLNRRSIASKKEAELQQWNKEIELAQFTQLYEKLRQWLECAEGTDEKTWQNRIHDIIRLLNPKYILGIREISIPGVDGYDKRPDFLLVDVNGYVDVMEIKKPSVRLLTEQSSYRNNYVPTRELAGTVQQIEKYIHCLSDCDKSKKEQIYAKLKKGLPNDISLKIVNPQGVLILGRSDYFNSQQKSDLELIKRQYKHIADIMTYDDLLSRIGNIISALKISN